MNIADKNQDIDDNLNNIKTKIKQAYFQEMVTFFNDNDLNDVKNLYETFRSSFVKFLKDITESKDVRNAFSKQVSNGFQKFVDTKNSLYNPYITKYRLTSFTDKQNTIHNSERFLIEIQSLYESFKSKAVDTIKTHIDNFKNAYITYRKGVIDSDTTSAINYSNNSIEGTKLNEIGHIQDYRPIIKDYAPIIKADASKVSKMDTETQITPQMKQQMMQVIENRADIIIGNILSEDFYLMFEFLLLNKITEENPNDENSLTKKLAQYSTAISNDSNPIIINDVKGIYRLYSTTLLERINPYITTDSGDVNRISVNRRTGGKRKSRKHNTSRKPNKSRKHNKSKNIRNKK